MKFLHEFWFFYIALEYSLPWWMVLVPKVSVLPRKSPFSCFSPPLCSCTGIALRLHSQPWHGLYYSTISRAWFLNEINPEYSLEGMMLKLQYFGYLMWRANSLEKTLMLGKTEGRRRGRQRMRWLDSITNSMNMNLSKLQVIVEDRGAWRASVPEVINSQTWLNDSTTARNCIQYLVITSSGKDSEEI